MPDREARNKLGMKPEDPGPLKDKKVSEELKAKYLPLIDDGIANMQKALEIDKEYDDAMAYMNLLIRERADLAETPRRVQEGHRRCRQLGAEGARDQEDQGGADAGDRTHYRGEIAERKEKCKSKQQAKGKADQDALRAVYKTAKPVRFTFAF